MAWLAMLKLKLKLRRVAKLLLSQKPFRSIVCCFSDSKPPLEWCFCSLNID
jgi:hypothetical protein